MDTGAGPTVLPYPAILGRIAEMRARCDAATANPELVRYEHGGGRSYVIDNKERRLVADYYHESDREFYHAARTDLPLALDLLEKAVRALERCQNEGAQQTLRQICAAMTKGTK